jgi:hypothetical protein
LRRLEEKHKSKSIACLPAQPEKQDMSGSDREEEECTEKEILYQLRRVVLM